MPSTWCQGTCRARLSGPNHLNLSSDSRGLVVGRAGLNVGWKEGGEWRRSLNLNFTMRPSPIVEVQMGPDLSMSRTPAQCMTRIDDAFATQTFGHRHVFADLEQTTLSFDTPVNVTSRPTSASSCMHSRSSRAAITVS